MFRSITVLQLCPVEIQGGGEIDFCCSEDKRVLLLYS